MTSPRSSRAEVDLRPLIALLATELFPDVKPLPREPRLVGDDIREWMAVPPAEREAS